MGAKKSAPLGGLEESTRYIKTKTVWGGGVALALPWNPTKNSECLGLPPMIPMQHSNLRMFCWKTKVKQIRSEQTRQYIQQILAF